MLSDGPDLMPAYTVSGEAIPGERRIRVRGYPGGSPRTGNWVNQQFQLDALGEVLQLLAAAAGWTGWSRTAGGPRRPPSAAIEQRWTKPEAGLWELDDRRWTHSRLACVAGLRSIAAAAAGPPGGHGARQAGGLDRPGRPDHGPASATPCTPPGGGSALPTTSASTRRCCCR